jgi:antitoxin (DNA-binding transcriptional repressor) of toxin-antitoxin stability system
MKVSAQYAQEHFADILNAAESGEPVEIARPDKPTLKLVLTTPVAPAKPAGQRVLGAGRGELRVPSEQEWRQMDKELERQMNDAPLMTSGEI